MTAESASSRSIVRLNPPAAGRGRRQRGRIAVDEGSAGAGKEIGVGRYEAARIRDRPGIAPVNRRLRRSSSAQARLRQALSSIDRFRKRTPCSVASVSATSAAAIERGLSAVQGIIAASLHEIIRAGFLDQHVMLARRLGR